MAAEAGDVRLVEGREGVDVGEEAQGLGDVVDRCTHVGELRLQVLDRLGGLRGHAAGDDRAVVHTELAADDDPLTGADGRGVGAEGFAHPGIVRARSALGGTTPTLAPMSISRRHLLAGAGALFALAACGDDSSSGSSGSTSGDSEPDPGTAGFTIAQRYPTNTFVPGIVRLPISLANKQSLLTTGPAELKGRVLDSNDKQIATVSASIHSKDIVIPYWPVNVQVDKPGIYTLRIDGDDGFGAPFQVTDPAQVTVPYIGSTLPPFDTPTVDNHRGVEPYCTLTPAPCPLHDITLTQAMATGM